jgi:hypothetical protein
MINYLGVGGNYYFLGAHIFIIILPMHLKWIFGTAGTLKFR